MDEQHPIVPLNKKPAIKIRKKALRKDRHDLILNIKTQHLEVNFYQGINHHAMSSIVSELINHD